MNNYETALILDPEWEEEERNDFVERLEKVIESFSGGIIDREEWGLRKLAYRILKHTSGYYLFLRYSGSKGVVEEMERVLGLNERVLRFLTTKFEKDIRGKYPKPPTIDEILDRDITELQSLRAQWRRGVSTKEEGEEKPGEKEATRKSQEEPAKTPEVTAEQEEVAGAPEGAEETAEEAEIPGEVEEKGEEVLEKSDEDEKEEEGEEPK